MRRAVVAVAAALLLGAPAVLAFFSGGYFAEPRIVAAIVIWALVLALTALGPAPLPSSRAGRIALAGLVILTLWSALSVTWAPLKGPAIQSVQRLVLYTGALLVAVGVLRVPRVLRAVEPALAAGIALVIGYGLAGRLLPGIIELERSRSAGGRLEQPITYWNAEGALAAMGLVLCARLAGDRTRPGWMRVAAAAAAGPLGAGVYLSYSRGAIAVALLGLIVLVAAAPSRAQARAAAVALAAAVAAAAVSAAFGGVASLDGSLGDRTRDGAIALALIAALAAGAGVAAARVRAAAPGPAPRWSRRLAPVSAVLLAAVVIGLVVGGLGERPSDAQLSAGADARRLTTATSYRYEYWRVALRTFGREPLTGLGAGGFRVAWLKERPVAELVRDAHSIELEMVAELGLPGLLAFLLLAGGVGAAARTALRREPEVAAGAAAATLVWFVHASIDWDWQLPAVSLPAIVLAGALITVSERRAGPGAAAPPAPAGPSRDRVRA
ncbi:MAG TPA: O-antigen ligase family protein [Solirubrobacteraceae bacterium]|nr:O-antigen ligase family protein [Solirubrobacteraceae bacterium]